MKHFRLFSLLLLITAFGLTVANGGSNGFDEPGRLLIKHSPVLGINVGVVVQIDGRQAGAFTKGHVFERYLAPGRHHIEVMRNGRLYGSSEMWLFVQPGQTYRFTAIHNVDELVLVPQGLKYFAWR